MSEHEKASGGDGVAEQVKHDASRERGEVLALEMRVVVEFGSQTYHP